MMTPSIVYCTISILLFFCKIRWGTKKQLRLFHICFVIRNFVVVVVGVFLLENLLEHWLCGCPVQAFVIQALLLALCALVIINAISLHWALSYQYVLRSLDTSSHLWKCGLIFLQHALNIWARQVNKTKTTGLCKQRSDYIRLHSTTYFNIMLHCYQQQAILFFNNLIFILMNVCKNIVDKIVVHLIRKICDQ